MKQSTLKVLLACIALSVGIVATGCDADDGNSTVDPDAMTMTDTTGGDTDTTTDPDGTTTPDGTECCTDASCGAQGLVCNTTSCMCEASGAACSNVGDTCKPEEDPGAGFVCAGVDENTFECLQACDPAAATEPCQTGSICSELGEEGSGIGACLVGECDGFFADDACDGGKCLPIGNGAAICVDNGTVVEGEACEAIGDCGDGLLCVGGTCAELDCTPLTAGKQCEGNAECSGLSFGDDAIDIGFCVSPCTAFDGSECADGEYCQPDSRNDASGRIEGACTDDAGGTAQPGDACGQPGPATTCTSDPASLCVGISETEAECQQFCDPESDTSGVGACPGDLGCVEGAFNDPATGGILITDFGFCQETCTPYTGEASGCGEGEFCDPNIVFAEVGDCVPSSTGTGVVGDSCTEDTDCVDGTICLTSEADDQGNPISRECRQLCSPNSPQGAPGACGEGEGCFGFSLGQDNQGQNIPAAIGYCDTTCELAPGDPLNPTVGCEDTAQTCVPGFLFGTPFDICTELGPEGLKDEFEACDPANEFSLCRPTGFCVDAGQVTGNEVACLEFCGTAAGAFGTTMHPHCTRQGATCSALFQTQEFGVCGNE